jgi:hypothetical protein
MELLLYTQEVRQLNNEATLTGRTVLNFILNCSGLLQEVPSHS